MVAYRQVDDAVTSWAAHWIPCGAPVRYVLDAGGRSGRPGDDAAVRLVFGESDQVELGLALSEVAPVIAVLRSAVREAEGAVGESDEYD